ncbi:outer membrane beta-barrel protein [Pseudopedobacter beijingensis]|uniref:Outer membrane beta-barrel protein n=1 Tax=Pseudopedobacter beijingensis TaxID=1207056 RepID=A0ABW4IIR0_9SPHI
MRVCIILFFILLKTSILVAQSNKEVGNINGNVKDETTGESIDFAGVSVYKTDSEVAIKNFMTDLDGKFSFGELPYGIYKLKISFMGYQAKTIDEIVLNTDNNDVKIDVKLTPITLTVLDEVVVTASKPMIEFGADTITFNVDQSIYAQGATATDLLRSVPMVTVDPDGKPTIAGKVNTRVFIDGKPSDYTSETLTDLLNVLPSEAIQKIEVITNPEARYSADGDGIINIVLKKGYTLGVTSGLAFTTTTQGTYNGTAYAAYSDKKLTVNGSYGFKHNRNITDVDLNRINYNAASAVSSYMNQLSNSKSLTDGHNARASVNWDITPLQNLRASVNYNLSDLGGESFMDDFRFNAANSPTQTINQDIYNANKNNAFTVNADYTLKFKRRKGESISAGFTYFDNGIFRDRDLSRLYYNKNGVKNNENSQYRSNDIKTGRFNFNADYVKNLSKFATLSLGTQITLGSNSNDQYVTGYDYVNAVDTISRLTSKFDYDENIYAFYASYRLRTKSRWTFRGGVRSEFTDLNFYDTSIQGLDTRPYHNLFPNISINKTYKKKYNFGLSYSMRVTRPRENALNPLIDDTNQSNVSFGNPNLRPSYTNQFQLSFGTAGAKWSFTPRLNYTTTDKIIERFRISPDSITYENLGSNKALTFSLFGNYRLAKSITLTGGYTVSYRAYESKSALQRPTQGYSHRGNMSITGQLPHSIMLEGQLNYYSNALAQGKNSSSVTTSFGLRKTFLKNRLNARVAAFDPFKNRNLNEIVDVLTNTGGSYHQERNVLYNSTNYSFTIGYRFMNTKKQKAKEDVGKVLESQQEGAEKLPSTKSKKK